MKGFYLNHTVRGTQEYTQITYTERPHLIWNYSNVANLRETIITL